MEVIGDLDKQVCSIWIFVAAFGVWRGLILHQMLQPATSSLRIMEHEACGRHGFSSSDMVRPTFRNPPCMKLQGLVGNMVKESLGLEWHLGPLNKGLL